MSDNSNTPNPQNQNQPDKEPTELEAYSASLQEELLRCQRDMAALQGEFNDLAETDDGTLTPEAVRKSLIAGAPAAIQQIITLSTMGESDSVRLNASKYIVDVAYGKIAAGDPADTAFKTFLESLTKAKAKTPPAPSPKAPKKPATKDEILGTKKNDEGML